MEIAVISGKGGTGKSSISAAFMSLVSNVMAVDCDVDASNLYLLFHPFHDKELVFVSDKHAKVDNEVCIGCGRCEELCRFDAIEMTQGKAVIDEISCDGCALCYRICPVDAITMIPVDKSRMYIGTFRHGNMVYGRLAPGEENSGKMVNQIREISKNIAKEKLCPVTILDGPPGIGCPVLSTITGVDKVVIVTEPTLSGFSDLKRAVELVRQYSLPTYVIINKCTLNQTVARQVEDWCAEKNVPVVALLPFSPEMVEALVEGKTIVEYRPQSDMTNLLKKALSEILF